MNAVRSFLDSSEVRTYASDCLVFIKDVD